MPEEKNIQQIADEFVTALVNTVREGTVQEVVEKNKDDALDITNIAAALPLKEMPPEVVKYLKELSQIVKDTSMDTRHDLNLAFPPSHFSGESNPLMLYYKAFYDTVAYYTALIQSTPEMCDALIKAMAEKIAAQATEKSKPVNSSGPTRIARKTSRNKYAKNNRKNCTAIYLSMERSLFSIFFSNADNLQTDRESRFSERI